MIRVLFNINRVSSLGIYYFLGAYWITSVFSSVKNKDRDYPLLIRYWTLLKVGIDL
jgi:hypothetical protein